MNFLDALILGISMAVDCMCVGASDGISESGMKKRKMFLIALIFGFMQGAMPTIGYFVGYLIKDYVSKYIPWIAFAILMFLGIKTIIECIIDIKKDKKEKEKNPDYVPEKKVIKISDILLQGVATSIDALTIGFIYIDKEISVALITFLIIGVITFALSLLTIFLGKKIGSVLQKVAPFIAGGIFILMAIKFLVSAFI
jgi:manganese efflux pump family protein